jgi:hypothetical protein
MDVAREYRHSQATLGIDDKSVQIRIDHGNRQGKINNQYESLWPYMVLEISSLTANEMKRFPRHKTILRPGQRPRGFRIIHYNIKEAKIIFQGAQMRIWRVFFGLFAWAINFTTYVLSSI